MIKYYGDNGTGTKIRIEDLPPEAWNIVKGITSSSKLIPIVRRCLNYRRNTISAIPWKFTNKSGDVLFDSSEAIPDNYKRLANPIIDAIAKIETSLIYKSCAYYLIEEARVLDPTTITPLWDIDFGLVGFERIINGSRREFDIDEIIYFTESGISETTPIESIIDSVELDSTLIKSVDTYVSQYFTNGTIKATIITTKEQSFPTKEEVSKIESFLNRQIKGLTNAFKSIFLRVPLTATVVGSGLEDFDPKLIDAKVLSIVTAFEVPLSAVLPNAANYATAISDKRLFYESVGIPRINYIHKLFNDEYLNSLGISIMAEPEKLSVFQEDETQRSQSLNNLVTAGFDVLDAADILGYDIPDDVRTRLEDSRNMPNIPPLSSFVFNPNNGKEGVETDEIVKLYSIT